MGSAAAIGYFLPGHTAGLYVTSLLHVYVCVQLAMHCNSASTQDIAKRVIDPVAGGVTQP